ALPRTCSGRPPRAPGGLVYIAPMIVMKFGGTSVGEPERFEVALRLVAERLPRDPVVVVSALAGTTNLLVELCREPGARRELSARLLERHAGFARAVGLDAACLSPHLEGWREELAGPEGSAPWVGERRARVLAYGERLAAELF